MFGLIWADCYILARQSWITSGKVKHYYGEPDAGSFLCLFFTQHFSICYFDNSGLLAAKKRLPLLLWAKNLSFIYLDKKQRRF
jgi:hypothetical protein